MPRQFTLEKNERLKSRKLIDQLFREGKKINLPPFLIYYCIANSSVAPLQFGAGVSSKNFKKAVDRNRVKRLIRETYRLQKTDLLAHLKKENKSLSIFFIYTGKELPDYKELYDKMGKALGRLLTCL